MLPTPRRRKIRLLSGYVLVFLVCEFSFSTPAVCQSKQPPPMSAGSRGNARISRIVAEINPKNIENTIRKLVSFGTRNTLSEQNNPNRGIGAARDWLYAEFQKAAAQSEGRMTVEKQTFEQPKAARVPQP